MSVIFCMENIWKRILFPSPHWIKLENFVMQLKRQSVEAWQNEKHYSKANNTNENQIPRRKFQTSWPCVRRSGQATTLVVCAVISLSFQAAVLLTKTAINHRFFFQSSLRWSDGLKKFQLLWVKELLLYNRMEAFIENFHQKWKNASCGAQFRYFQIK